MSERSTGDLIKAGEFQKACVRADTEFGASGNIFPLRNKVIALLQLDKVDEAIRLSEEIIGLNAGSTDSDFIGVWLGGSSDNLSWQSRRGKQG